MVKDVYISEDIKYIGVDDKDIDLFEGQYVVPNGISYNSYIIKDSKIAIMDTVDSRKTTEWLANLEAELGDRVPDYLVISHMEPDHSSNIGLLAEKYSDMKIVGNDKIFDLNILMNKTQKLIYKVEMEEEIDVFTEEEIKIIKKRKNIEYNSTYVRIPKQYRA